VDQKNKMCIYNSLPEGVFGSTFVKGGKGGTSPNSNTMVEKMYYVVCYELYTNWYIFVDCF
jgi:hypothetical protein